MARNPYSLLLRVQDGTMTIGDVIENIRSRFGDRAAESIRITVH